MRLCFQNAIAFTLLDLIVLLVPFCGHCYIMDPLQRCWAISIKHILALHKHWKHWDINPAKVLYKVVRHRHLL